MNAFILVGGMFTGSWIWEETAARLADAGARAHPVELTGLGARRADSGPGTDLEAHVADVLRVIDAIPAGAGPDLVLVGHGYGVHPVLAAADRRAGRIARLVYLDAGPARDGAPALAAVPDRALREKTADAGAQERGGALAPPAAAAEWQRWGSTAGLSGPALDRLTRLAAPQPLGTLLQPLRLSGAVSQVPATGVLCTAGGAGIDMVQMQVGLGDPALQALAEQGVTFFELATGHWPMLSLPAELAAVLLSAAEGGGRRLIPASGELPPHLRPFLFADRELPVVPRERSGAVDLYAPEGDGPRGARPAVVFVHGGPVPAGARPTPRDWPAFTGYARLAAGQGLVAATVDHRLHGTGDHALAAQDVAAAVDRVRADPRVDAGRVALWFFSGGGLLSADWLQAPPPWLRCAALTYPLLAPPPAWAMPGGRFRPADAVREAGSLPVVLTRAGRESPEFAATVEGFLVAARRCGAHVDVIDVPDGRHGFETLDRTDTARAAVHQAVRTVRAHLAR
ncbi:alpha/beta hydrolase [Streptomyces globosus]|uniref:Alpha/beta hydrolase n=1 Tax=Streptomyces globosus TaxID=68209 RepID=A0A344U190_9ACTN|nr:alpha/beta fold hydrolase [Streptomyces globosus]AXE24661.1 alpha/beta hydrolase [Streptomyces globosus]